MPDMTAPFPAFIGTPALDCSPIPDMISLLPDMRKLIVDVGNVSHVIVLKKRRHISEKLRHLVEAVVLYYYSSAGASRR